MNRITEGFARADGPLVGSPKTKKNARTDLEEEEEVDRPDALRAHLGQQRRAPHVLLLHLGYRSMALFVRVWIKLGRRGSIEGTCARRAWILLTSGGSRP